MMFYFPEIVPKNLHDCCKRDHEEELYVIIFLDMKGEGVGGGMPSMQDKNFSEIWVLKLRV